MWIIPKTHQLYSAFAPDMVDSISDLSLVSESLEQSLMWRSKPSPLKTWLTRWKRGSWIQPLFTQILKPSQWNNFETELIALLPDSRANHFLVQEIETEQKTQGTCGPTLRKQLSLFDQPSVSLKTSKESFPQQHQTGGQFSTMSSADWKRWVTGRRQEYLVRVKSDQPINENGYLLWPTEKGQALNLPVVIGNQQNMSMGKISQEQSLDQVKISGNGKNQGSFNWTTPDCSDRRSEKSKQQGLSNVVKAWATPNTLDALPPRSPEGVIKQATGARRGRTRPANLREQVDPVTCEIYSKVANWPTPCTRDHKGANGPGG